MSRWMALAALVACSGKGEPAPEPVVQAEICKTYLECIANGAPTRLDNETALYGPESDCWDSETQADNCESGCESAIITFKVEYGDDACTEPPDPGFCEVIDVFDNQCMSCHSSATAFGGLDLETDPHGAMVDVEGAFGVVMVVPGDPENSMLYLKMTDQQLGSHGTDMPPSSGGVDEATEQVIRYWIEQGAGFEECP